MANSNYSKVNYPDDPNFFDGEELAYSCDETFELYPSANSTITCDPSGNWTGSIGSCRRGLKVSLFLINKTNKGGDARRGNLQKNLNRVDRSDFDKRLLISAGTLKISSPRKVVVRQKKVM